MQLKHAGRAPSQRVLRDRLEGNEYTVAKSGRSNSPLQTRYKDALTLLALSCGWLVRVKLDALFGPPFLRLGLGCRRVCQAASSVVSVEAVNVGLG